MKTVHPKENNNMGYIDITDTVIISKFLHICQYKGVQKYAYQWNSSGCKK
jgi:hypothetical protein